MAAKVITVSQDGSGDYRTVQEAIDAVPLCNTCRTIIRLSPGIYKQPIYVPKTKNFITLAGLRPEITVLTWNNTATKIDHHQVKYASFCATFSGFLPRRMIMPWGFFFLQASRLIGTGTFGCGTVIVEGEDFISENVTFENSSPQVSFKNFLFL